jgi:hypothetical protein
MNIVTAEITTVQIGQVSFSGVMFPDGSYGVAIPQLVTLNLVPPDRSRKQLESLAGMTFKTHQKAKTKLNSKAVNVIGLQDFEVLLAKLDRAGNKNAQDFRDALVGLSLHQLFSDAFGIQFEKEDRQKWLENRFKTKHDFRPLTDELQKAGFKEPKDYGKYIHLMQSKLGIEDGTRDELDNKTLMKLVDGQTKLTAYMSCGLTPMQALNKLQPSAFFK